MTRPGAGRFYAVLSQELQERPGQDGQRAAGVHLLADGAQVHRQAHDGVPVVAAFDRGVVCQKEAARLGQLFESDCRARRQKAKERVERLPRYVQLIQLRLQARGVAALALVFSDLLRQLKAQSLETVGIVSAPALHAPPIQERGHLKRPGYAVLFLPFRSRKWINRARHRPASSAASKPEASQRTKPSRA